MKTINGVTLEQYEELHNVVLKQAIEGFEQLTDAGKTTYQERQKEIGKLAKEALENKDITERSNLAKLIKTFHCRLCRHSEESVQYKNMVSQIFVDLEDNHIDDILRRAIVNCNV